jgi:hypothetical protein
MTPSPLRVERFSINPLITPASSPALGDNINGPSVIRIPDWLPNPLGKYYLYFAHHAGTCIRSTAMEQENAQLSSAKAAAEEAKAEQRQAQQAEKQQNDKNQQRIQALEQEKQQLKEKNSQLEKHQTELDQRQQLIHEEITRAEAQIDLIKDVLLREPGL